MFSLALSCLCAVWMCSFAVLPVRSYDAHLYSRNHRYTVPRVSRIARFPSYRRSSPTFSDFDPLTSPNHYSAFRASPSHAFESFPEHPTTMTGSYSNSVNHKIKVNHKVIKKPLPVMKRVTNILPPPVKISVPITLPPPDSSKEAHHSKPTNQETVDVISDSNEFIDYVDHIDAVPKQKAYSNANHLDSKDNEKRRHKFQPYAFGYEADDGWGNKQYRHEKSSEPGSVRGSYGFVDKDGIYRHVDYVADKNGFRAKIRTSEPGTETKNPASVLIDSKPIPVSPMKSQNLPIVQLKTRHEVPTHLTQESSHRSTAAQLSVAADEDYLDASNSDQIERAQQMELASLPMDRMQMDYDSNGNHHPQNDLWNVDSNWDESELHRRSEAHVEHYNTFGMRHSAR